MDVLDGRIVEINSKIMDFISVRFGSLSDNFVSFLVDLGVYLDRFRRFGDII